MHIDPERWAEEYPYGPGRKGEYAKWHILQDLRTLSALSVRDRGLAVRRLAMAAIVSTAAERHRHAKNAVDAWLYAADGAVACQQDITNEVEGARAKGVLIKEPAEVADYLCDYPHTRAHVQAAVAAALERIDGDTVLSLEIERYDCWPGLRLDICKHVKGDAEAGAFSDLVHEIREAYREACPERLSYENGDFHVHYWFALPQEASAEESVCA